MIDSLSLDRAVVALMVALGHCCASEQISCLYKLFKLYCSEVNLLAAAIPPFEQIIGGKTAK